MKATYNGKYCYAEHEAIVLYEKNGYGRVEKDGRIRLSPSEALYLALRGKVELDDYTFETLLTECAQNPNFLRDFIIYRDIRERGYVITVGVPSQENMYASFRIFPRGQCPIKGTSRYLLRVLSERDCLDLTALLNDVMTARNKRKQFLIGVLDDEYEITYYEIRMPKLMPKPVGELPTGIVAHLTGSVPFVVGDGIETLKSNWFGTMIDARHLYLSTLETAWLLNHGCLTLESGLSYEEYCTVATEADPEFRDKEKLYVYFKNIGYYPRSGYKYGHHFRIYTEMQGHSEILAQAVPKGSVYSMRVISRSVRLAHSVKKRMLFVCLNNDEIIPVEFARIRL